MISTSIAMAASAQDWLAEAYAMLSPRSNHETAAIGHFTLSNNTCPISTPTTPAPAGLPTVGGG
jgi:hypothetical protein